MTIGLYMPIESKDIKIYQCRICSSLTYLNFSDDYIDFFDNDIFLRNEAIKLNLNLFNKEKVLDKLSKF
jgi:hypothetical protein